MENVLYFLIHTHCRNDSKRKKCTYIITGHIIGLQSILWDVADNAYVSLPRRLDPTMKLNN